MPGSLVDTFLHFGKDHKSGPKSVPETCLDWVNLSEGDHQRRIPCPPRNSPIRGLVAWLAQQFEKGREPPWSPAGASADTVATLLEHIVPFEIAITRMVGKFKASRQRPPAERGFVAQSLLREGLAPADIAELIRSPPTVGGQQPPF